MTPAEIEALAQGLDKLAVPAHYYCDDSWYSCPARPEGCSNPDAGTECNCGADRKAAIAREAAAALRELSDPDERLISIREYALYIAKYLHAEFYPSVPQWEPLPDTLGLLTQIDNMVSGIARQLNQLRAEAALRAEEASDGR